MKENIYRTHNCEEKDGYARYSEKEEYSNETEKLGFFERAYIPNHIGYKKKIFGERDDSSIETVKEYYGSGCFEKYFKYEMIVTKTWIRTPFRQSRKHCR